MAVILTGTEYIDLDAHGAALDIRTRPITVYAEIVTTSDDSNSRSIVVHGADGSESEYEIYLFQGNVRVYWDSTSTFDVSGGPVDNGVLRRVALDLSDDFNELGVWKDGSFIDGDGLGGASNTANHGNTTRIGSHPDFANFVGQISNVAIWDVELSGSDLGDLTDGTIDPGDLPTGLQGWWPLDFDARDISGNDRHGTTVNDPDFTEEPPAAEQDITPGAQTVDATPGTLSLSIGVMPGAVTVDATPGAVTVAPGAADITPAAVTVAATPGTVTVATGATGITPDAVTIDVTPSTVTLDLDIPLDGPTITATPGSVAVTQGLSVLPDAVTIEATPGTATLVAGAADITPDALTIDVTPGGLTLDVDVTLAGPTVQATPGTLSVAAGAVDITPDAVTVAVTPGALSITGGVTADPNPFSITHSDPAGISHRDPAGITHRESFAISYQEPA